MPAARPSGSHGSANPHHRDPPPGRASGRPDRANGLPRTRGETIQFGRLLVGADDLEVLADEDVVRPVHADVVDLVLAVAH